MKKDLSFLHCGHNPRCTAHVDKRFDYHTLQLMTRGRVELWYDNRREVIESAGAWPCFPGPWTRFHAADAGGWWTHRYAAFSGPRVARWRREGLLLDGPQALTPRAARGLAPTLDRVISAVGRGRQMDLLRAAHELESLLLRLAELRQPALDPVDQAGQGGGVRPAWLDAVVHALEDTDAPDPDYAALAATQSMALSTLRRQFREALGVPLHAYRLTRKMAAARGLLAETALPVGEIANQLGYRDVYYFSRQFRQEVGVSPSRYRRSSQHTQQAGK